MLQAQLTLQERWLSSLSSAAVPSGRPSQRSWPLRLCRSSCRLLGHGTCHRSVPAQHQARQLLHSRCQDLSHQRQSRAACQRSSPCPQLGQCTLRQSCAVQSQSSSRAQAPRRAHMPTSHLHPCCTLATSSCHSRRLHQTQHPQAAAVTAGSKTKLRWRQPYRKPAGLCVRSGQTAAREATGLGSLCLAPSGGLLSPRLFACPASCWAVRLQQGSSLWQEPGSMQTPSLAALVQVRVPAQLHFPSHLANTLMPGKYVHDSCTRVHAGCLPFTDTLSIGAACMGTSAFSEAMHPTWTLRCRLGPAQQQATG